MTECRNVSGCWLANEEMKMSLQGQILVGCRRRAIVGERKAVIVSKVGVEKSLIRTFGKMLVMGSNGRYGKSKTYHQKKHHVPQAAGERNKCRHRV